MDDFALPVPLEETEEPPQDAAANPTAALMALARQQQQRREEALARLRGLSERQAGEAGQLRSMAFLSSLGQNPLLQGLQREAGQQGAQLQGMAAQAEARADTMDRSGGDPLSLLRGMGRGGFEPMLSDDPTSPESKAAQARVKAIIPDIAPEDLATVTARSETDFLKYHTMAKAESGRNVRFSEKQAADAERFAKMMGFRWADLSQDERLAMLRLAEAQAARAAATTAKQEEGIERQVLKLSERLENMPGMKNDLVTLTDYAQREDIPGVGQTGIVPAPLLTNDGARVRQAVRGVVGTLLKEQSGTAVSEGEIDRKLEELGMGVKATDRDFRLGLKRLLENTDAVMSGKQAGASPEAVRRFRQRGGTTAQDLPKPKPSPAIQPTTATQPATPQLGPPPAAMGDTVRVKINGVERPPVKRSQLEAMKKKAAERKDTLEVIDG